MIDELEARLHVVRHQLLDAARHLAGAKALAARLYGAGPVTALAMAEPEAIAAARTSQSLAGRLPGGGLATRGKAPGG